jgi:hypothetical protein
MSSSVKKSRSPRSRAISRMRRPLRPSFDGQVHDRRPIGQHEQRAVVAEAHVHADEHRHRERDDACASLRRVVAETHLALVVVGAGRVDGENVPIDGALTRERHVGEQRDLVVTEAVEAAVADQLERGALVFGHDLAQREHFVA